MAEPSSAATQRGQQLRDHGDAAKPPQDRVCPIARPGLGHQM